jgi:hypothetical protein
MLGCLNHIYCCFIHNSAKSISRELGSVKLSQELNLNIDGICSCGDKLHGAPRCETGPSGPILAVPLNLQTFPLRSLR